MPLSSTAKPKIEGLGTSDRKLAVARPEHIKRALLILLGLSAFLVIAALVKGCSNSQAYQERLEDRRAAKSKQEEEAAKRAQANAEGGNDPASTFQQDLATFQRNGGPGTAAVSVTGTAATDAAAGTGTATAGGPNGAAVKLQEARNEERLRAYQDLREPLALAVPSGDKPVGTTTSASVRVVSPSAPEATGEQAPPDAETQALLQQRARLAEQLRLLEQSAAGSRQ